MSQEQNPVPPNNEWKSLSIETRLYIAWIVFKSTTWIRIESKLLIGIKRIDLWLFPPLAFLGSYKSILQIMPINHPMTYMATLATAFMTMTLTMFMIRPVTKVHWIRNLS